ncbi:hypothetical protein A3762_02405 [Oleiphilus sp. HI0125]|uniref:type II secretion system minor pseudopilin GspH n=1 Tax=Oleiphilus sp. HI0125 TaxID=1822266 RepID=UPI0007C2F735|nr:type II secretion system minor pseudopilin GspH [Oleiphilus sp. HI0125]KZZ61301.1 hypothetical protein A3762_02405 [Oleiphilus sp. HI0125]
MFFSSEQYQRNKGFTLIELLVVMVLLGLLAGLATTSFGGNQARELDIETNRMHALMRTAANEAIFSNAEIGVRISEQAYDFISYNEEEQNWSLATSPVLKPQVLPEWMFLEFEREGEEVVLPSSEKEESEFGGSVFDDDDSSSTSDSSLRDKKTPDFMFLSSGDITNFTVRLSLRDDLDIFKEVTLNEFGEISLPHLEDESQ